MMTLLIGQLMHGNLNILVLHRLKSIVIQLVILIAVIIALIFLVLINVVVLVLVVILFVHFQISIYLFKIYTIYTCFSFFIVIRYRIS